MTIKVDVARRFTLNGTIDGHDPIGATFHIAGPQGWFWLTAISVNWGRGYAPGEFKANVMEVLSHTEGHEHVVLFIQELDEADKAPERKIFMHEMEPGTTLVPHPPIPGRETIAISPGDHVTRYRRIMTMDQGTKIGAPEGTGPTRYFVSCIVTVKGVKIGLGNTHPHRNMANHVVQEARREGERIMRHQIDALVKLTDVTLWGGDMNDTHFPSMHPREKVAHERGLDTLRYIVA